MLTLNDLRRCKVRTQDGVVGRVDDLFFDDRNGQVRYVVLALGRWPRARRVLIDPTRISYADHNVLYLGMTREEVQCAPHPSTQPPVSLQQKLQRSTALDLNASPKSPAKIKFELTPFDALLKMHGRAQSAAHLRSVREVIGYEVELESGRAGYLAEVWLNPMTWHITHLSLQLRAVKRRVAIPATLVRGVSWSTNTVRLSARWEQSSQGTMLVPRVKPPRSRTSNVLRESEERAQSRLVPSRLVPVGLARSRIWKEIFSTSVVPQAQSQ